MGILDFLLLGLVAAGAVVAVWGIRKGRGGCGSCSGCPHAESCERNAPLADRKK